jgi:hypothetical protein
MTRDILYVQFGPGVKVYFKPNRKIGIGTMTGESYTAGTGKVTRWTVVFPHNRTKSKTFSLSCEASSLEIVR